MDDGDEATLRKAVDVLGTLPERPRRALDWRKKLITNADLRDLARSYGEWGIHRLAELAKDAAVPVNVQVDCIKTLLDRGFGKAQPFEDGQGDNSVRITIRHLLSDRAQAANGSGNGKVIEHDE